MSAMLCSMESSSLQLYVHQIDGGPDERGSLPLGTCLGWLGGLSVGVLLTGRDLPLQSNTKCTSASTAAQGDHA